MAAITKREFDIRQPYFPEESEHDAFYIGIANGLIDEMAATEFGGQVGPDMCKHIALTLVGYYQDVINDAGVWRSFVEANRQLYGWSVPFHTLGEQYIDFELNVEDVRFVIWYDIAMMDMRCRTINPHDKSLLGMADKVYQYLEDHYDEAPLEDKYNIARGLSLTDESDQEQIFALARWLFNMSWLMTPAFAMSLSEMMADPEVAADKDGITLNKRIDEAVAQSPTGPLALYTPEWVYLMLNGKLPKSAYEDPQPDTDAVHPYYAKFTAATGGKEIAYFATYEELNTFFIEALGWEKDQRHLNQMEGEHDFVLLVNKNKGMLLAKNVAKCIADPDNNLYDAAYARGHAMDLLTERGLCPADLLHYIYSHNWLPEARFTDSDDVQLVAENWDFIARCYLQEYYRGD